MWHDTQAQESNELSCFATRLPFVTAQKNFFRKKCSRKHSRGLNESVIQRRVFTRVIRLGQFSHKYWAIVLFWVVFENVGRGINFLGYFLQSKNDVLKLTKNRLWPPFSQTHLVTLLERLRATNYQRRLMWVLLRGILTHKQCMWSHECTNRIAIYPKNRTYRGGIRNRSSIFEADAMSTVPRRR
jgi:hypothetical protein